MLRRPIASRAEKALLFSYRSHYHLLIYGNDLVQSDTGNPGIKVRRERKRRNKRKGKEKRENSGARNLKRVELNSHKTPAIDDQK